MKIRSSLVATLGIAICVPLPCLATTYSITDLGTLPGNSASTGFGVNASGQVVGVAAAAGNSVQHAFLYTGGVMQDLGTLPANNFSQAWAINDSGQVVGQSTNFDTFEGADTHAFLYSSGTMQDLGTLGGALSVARGINASGQVVGISSLADSAEGDVNANAFVYSEGVMHDLGPGAAFGINDSGQIVGSSQGHAFRYSDGVMQDLGTLPGGTGSDGHAINAGGQVVGVSATLGDSAQHAFLYSGTLMHDLGTLPGDSFSEAWAINNSGQVVGESDSHAFLYRDGVMYDLNALINPSSGWEIQRAFGINDRGQITGLGTFFGQQDAFLLTPVPEPSSLVLAAVGFAGLAASRWRKLRPKRERLHGHGFSC